MSQITYHPNFPVEWAKNQPKSCGPKNCANCAAYGTFNGVFVGYCTNCLIQFNNTRGIMLFPGSEVEQLSDEQIWQQYPYMKGIKKSDIAASETENETKAETKAEGEAEAETEPDVFKLSEEEQRKLLMKGPIQLWPTDWIQLSDSPPDNKTMFNPGKVVRLTCPVSRFGDVARTLVIPSNSTWGQVYMTIYRYFHEYVLTQADIEEAMADNHYFEELVDSDLNNFGLKPQYHWIDVMGDAVFFEGITLDLPIGRARLDIGS